MEFIRGMDISSYFKMKDKGYQYYDEEGREVDVLEYGVKRGFNYGRLRIWNEPENIPESGGYCNLEQTIKMAEKFVQQGIGYVLDFHYSDWWADPGNQAKPKAWEHFSVDELENAVYEYTKDCLLTLDKAGVYPDMIQVGNEIRTGMLFPEGAVPEWQNLARFINAGIRAVRETQKQRDTKVIIHLDQGGKYEYFKTWFDNIMEHGVHDFDIIGLSYYPFWHGQYHEFKYNMDALVERYGKDLMVMEIAHPFRKSGGKFFKEEQERAAGFPANPEAQRKVLELIISIIGHVKDGRCLGFFYWEPFMRAPEDSDGWGVCMGIMDQQGRPTEGYKAINFDPMSIDDRKIAKIYCGDKGERISIGHLPASVRILYMDGHIEEKKVIWQKPEENRKTEEQMSEEIQADKEGQKSRDIQITGEIEEVPEEWKKITITISPENASENLIPNGSFQNGLEGFEVVCDETITKYGIKETGFWFQSTKNFHLEVLTSWLTVEKNTLYQAELIYRGGNTTGTNITFFAKSGREEFSCEVFPEEAVPNSYRLELPPLPEETIQLGLIIDAPTVSGEIQEIRLEKI